MLCALACGGASPSPAPTSPTPVQPGGPPSPPPPAVVAVAVSLSSGKGPGLIPGERTQLRAIATRADGSTIDCTQSAVWTSSNPAVAAFDPQPPGQLRAVARGQASVSARCDDKLSSALTLTVGSGIRVTGLEAYPLFVTGGVKVTLRAMEVAEDGSTIRDCGNDADWTSSNRNFASFNALRENELLFHRTGARENADVTITVRCHGATSQIVVPMRPYRVTGTVRSSTGEPLAGVLITEKYGHNAVFTDANGRYSTDFVETPPEVIMSLPGYDSHAQVFHWNAQPAIQLDGTLPVLPQLIARGSGKVCNLTTTDARYEAECVAAGASAAPAHTFTLPRDGNLRLKTYWPDPPGGSGIDDNLIVKVECGGVQVYWGEINGTQGGGFTRPAKAGACVATFTNITLLRVLPYEFTLDVQ